VQKYGIIGSQDGGRAIIGNLHKLLKLGKRVIPCQLNQFRQKFPHDHLRFCSKNSCW